MPWTGLGEGAPCHLLSSRWELCVPVIISLGALCHLSSLYWESRATCHHFTGSPVSPAVVSLGSSRRLLLFREGGLYHLLSFPLGGPCHLPSCHALRWLAGSHLCPLPRAWWGGPEPALFPALQRGPWRLSQLVFSNILAKDLKMKSYPGPR